MKDLRNVNPKTADDIIKHVLATECISWLRATIRARTPALYNLQLIFTSSHHTTKLDGTSEAFVIFTLEMHYENTKLKKGTVVKIASPNICYENASAKNKSAYTTLCFRQ